MWSLPFVAELCHCLPRNPNTSFSLSLHMLSTCLAEIRDPQKALPLSRLAWFSRLFYIYRVLYFLCFFSLYCVVLTVYYEKSLVAGFTGFSLCYLRLSVVHWVFVFFFSFYSLSYAFDMLRLLILPLSFFTLGAFWLFSVTVLRPFFFSSAVYTVA